MLLMADGSTVLNFWIDMGLCGLVAELTPPEKTLALSSAVPGFDILESFDASSPRPLEVPRDYPLD